MEMKLIIFTICKDEAATIKELLSRMPKKIKGIDTIETLVISDGSADATAKIARSSGATKVVEGLKQKRLSYRFQQAIDLALSMGADYVVNIDGDLQFAPEDIPKLLKPVVDKKADFVAADRFTDIDSGERRRPQHMPKGKYWANRLGAWIVGSLSMGVFRDVTCGFRAYNKKAMFAININSNYTYTQETFQVLALKKLNIVSMPITVTYYPGRQSRVVKSFWHFLFGSALNILRAYRDYAPLRFFGSASLAVGLPGWALGGFVSWHWASSGSLSPYIAFGVIALFLVATSMMLALLGLVADMFDRMLNNQEKILDYTKRLHYEKEN
jgi:glycosyltransferase involved in cell wall biosynthesis